LDEQLENLIRGYSPTFFVRLKRQANDDGGGGPDLHLAMITRRMHTQAGAKGGGFLRVGVLGGTGRRT
jgi:hypothetical protein